MRRSWLLILGVFGLLPLLASLALAAERFPPPDFTDHALPSITTPPSRAEAFEYVDLAVLTVGLGLASWLAIKRRSRRGLFALTVVSLVWLGFVREGCICPIGAIQNVTLALFDSHYAIPWTAAAVFALPLLFTLFFGRTFCAAVCPLGAVQELVAVRPINVPNWLDQALGVLAYVYLGAGVTFAATGAAFVICRYDPFVGFFRHSASINMLILGACFLVGGMFIGRPYCRYLCPYGAILGLLSKASKWHAKIPPDDCIQCRLCEDACPYGAIREPTAAQTAADRRRGRRRLALLLAACPVLVVAGFWLGRQLETPLAQVHPVVRQAERVYLEQTGAVQGTTDVSDAFRNTGRPVRELYAEADRLRATFRRAGGWFGAWVGLVIAVKLIYLSIRRRRTDYQPDRAGCVSCGRCFWYCPCEHALPSFPHPADDAQGLPVDAERRERRVPTRSVGTRIRVVHERNEQQRRLSACHANRGGRGRGCHRRLRAAVVRLRPAAEERPARFSDLQDAHGRARPASDRRAAQGPGPQLDLQLRTAYFRQRAFSEVGAGLLTVAVLVFLFSARTAVTLHRRIPSPTVQLGPSQDREAASTRIARWAVAATSAVMVAAAVMLVLSVKSPLPDGGDELATSQNPLQEAGPTPNVPRSQSGDGKKLHPAPEAPSNVAAEPSPSDAEVAKAWPRFRGPGGLGISAYTNVPDAWDVPKGKGILWKTPVPLPGYNSPVVWGKRVFLSGADKRRREVYCFDADNGKLLWQQNVPGTPQSNATPPDVSKDTGYAASTTASDGRRVFAIFANGDLAAFDVAGKPAWSKSLGVPESSYGYASSLTTYKNLLLVQFDQGAPGSPKSKLLAFDSATGNLAWQVKRPVPNSWSSPIVARVGDQDQLITSGDPWVIAYNLADHSELWRAKCLGADVGTSPVFADGRVFAANDNAVLSAIRADGHGDVTSTHVVWKGEDGMPDTCSPLATGEFVFLLTSQGVLTCYDAVKGGMLWEEDFAKPCSSSPSLVGKRLYIIAMSGKAWIVEPARDKCRRVAECDLGEQCVTSPAFQDGRIYLRGKQHIFCLGKPLAVSQ